MTVANRQNIDSVVAAKLCASCGACVAVCPKRAIRFDETIGGHLFACLDRNACVGCGLCADVCPSVDFGPSLRAAMPQDPFVGEALEAFVGKAADAELFRNSQSGGVVSAILIRALASGRIKGAVTVTMAPGAPPRPAARIARTRAEILSSQGSKYCPVPLLECLAALRSEDGPIAVVGLPCHLHGLNNIMDKQPKIRERIAFTIGLVCDRVLTYAAIDYLIAKAGVSKDAPVELRYRDKSVAGYPGDVRVAPRQGGGAAVLPAIDRIRLKEYLTPIRCRLCFDKMNVFADITVGDPHGLEGVDRKRGESALAVRTERGRAIIASVRDEDAIRLRPIAYSAMANGQRLDLKRAQWRGYLEEWQRLNGQSLVIADIVKARAPLPPPSAQYAEMVGRSLALDSFASRDELLKNARKSIDRGVFKQRLLLPARWCVRITRKLLSRFWRFAKPKSKPGPSFGRQG